MTDSIKTAIREAIIKVYTQKIEDAANRFERFNKCNIGKEFPDMYKPRVNKVIEFINPKTRRWNHKTLRNQYQTYVYTNEMYDEGLRDAINNVKNNSLSFTVQCNTDDSQRYVSVADPLNPTDSEIEYIYNCFGNRAEKMVGFEVRLHNIYNTDKNEFDCVWPVFDEVTMNEFNNTRDEYINAKAEWCAKYGCD